MLKKLDADRLWDYALKAVGQRAQTIGELRTKLRARAADPADIENTLAKLKEYGMLDDRRFAENFAAARLENQGFGKARALRDLRQRRVAPAVAEKAVERAYAESDEIALIEEYVRRKYRSTPRETLFQEDKDLASAFRRLRLAGFSSGKIVQVLKRFAKNPDLLDGLTETEM
ncbi:MAG: regulatory protein RecX [Bryobacterales bacterium]|nr:regulatory protein RecX [Bryobacterales bacterium]